MIHPVTGTYFEHLNDRELAFLTSDSSMADDSHTLITKRLIHISQGKIEADTRLVDLIESCLKARYLFEISSFNGSFQHTIYIKRDEMVAHSTVSDDLFDLISLPDIGTLRMLLRDDLMLRTEASGCDPVFTLKASEWKMALDAAANQHFDTMGEIFHSIAPSREIATRLWGVMSSPVMTTDVALTEAGSDCVHGRYTLLQGVDDFWMALYSVEGDIVTFTPGSALAAWKAFNALLGILDREPV